jgi:hypothetical protein
VVTACRCDGHVELVAITIGVSSTRLDEQTLHISTRRSYTPDAAVESDFGKAFERAGRPSPDLPNGARVTVDYAELALSRLTSAESTTRRPRVTYLT